MKKKFLIALIASNNPSTRPNSSNATFRYHRSSTSMSMSISNISTISRSATWVVLSMISISMIGTSISTISITNIGRAQHQHAHLLSTRIYQHQNLTSITNLGRVQDNMGRL